MCALVFNFYLQAVTQSPEEEELAVNASYEEGIQWFLSLSIYHFRVIFVASQALGYSLVPWFRSLSS